MGGVVPTLSEVSGLECVPTTLSALTIMLMKMPATARRRRIAASLYHDDALTDGLAEARVDVWARLGLSLKQRQFNNFGLL